MFRKRYLLGQIITVARVFIVGNCILVTGAVAQTSGAELPAECSAYESIPLPLEAEKISSPKTAPACASYRSYQGIGRPVNYSEARACAWQERLAQKADLGQNLKEPTAWVVGGSLILADIYFNGSGVKRNVPLAIRFACEFEEGTAKLALEDIAKVRSSGSHRGIEFCDYASTTFTMNFCSSYASQIVDDRRNRYYSSIKSSMTPEQQSAFEELLDAQRAYIEAHASEVDQGGTIRTVRTLGSKNILNDSFRTEIVHFERKQWPTLSENQIKLADTWLHREYERKLQQLRSRPKDETFDGAVTPDGLANAQKSWENYRTAWVAFARLRYPEAVAAIGAGISLARYRLLKTIQ